MSALTRVPPVRLVVVPDLPVQARRGELERLAEDVLSCRAQSAYGVTVHVAAVASRLLPPERISPAWHDYLGTCQRLGDIESGAVTEPGADRDEVRDLFAGDRAAALNVLLHGTAAGR